MWRWTRGEPARERRVAVHVELEQVEERIADEWDGAVELRLNAVVELERLARLVARREGRPLDFVRCIFEVFARLSEALGRYEVSYPLLCCLCEDGEGAYEFRVMHSTWMGEP